MSRRGGYKIIDLHKIPITTGTAVTIEGIYKQVSGTTKSIMISGALVDGIEIDDFYILFENAGEHYIGIEGDNKLTVGKDETLLWEDYKPSGSVTLKAGDNIQINGDVISATDTTYSAGGGITISTNNIIGVDYETLNSKYATPDDIVKYEAGDGISIIGNVISATGDVDVDLSNYLTIETYDADMSALNTNINNLNTSKQDKLTAGEGITISDDNTISASGSDVDLSDYVTTETYESDMTALNTNLNGKQDKLTAGNGITISDNKIYSNVNVESSNVSSELNYIYVKKEVNNGSITYTPYLKTTGKSFVAKSVTGGWALSSEFDSILGYNNNQNAIFNQFTETLTINNVTFNLDESKDAPRISGLSYTSMLVRLYNNESTISDNYTITRPYKDVTNTEGTHTRTDYIIYENEDYVYYMHYVEADNGYLNNAMLCKDAKVKPIEYTAGKGIRIYDDNSINVISGALITENNTLQIGNTWTVSHEAWSYVFSSEYRSYNSFNVSAHVYYNLEEKAVSFVVYRVGSGVNTSDNFTAANYSYWKAFIPLFNIEVLITYNSEDGSITSTKL